jgi:SAM-dependent methyltransferase
LTPEDIALVTRALAAGFIHDPVLEFGVGYDGPTCRRELTAAGFRHAGTDLHPGVGVDIVADFEDPSHLSRFGSIGPFGSAIILNVLEHTFDPIRVLDNALSLVKPGGTMLIIAPAVWPLHDFPFDCCRLLPNFYEEYARRRRLHIQPDFFEYVGREKVTDARNIDGSYRFPRPGRSPAHGWYSRIVHRAFNTMGRGMAHPSHLSVGCLFEVAQRPETL